MIHVFPPTQNTVRQPIKYTDHSTPCYYVQNGQALNNKVYIVLFTNSYVHTRKIMETKEAQKIYSNYFYAVNKCGIELRKLPRVCKLRGKFQQNLRHRYSLSAKNQQLYEWYPSENTMFQNPRRRKLHQKRVHQGHNSLVNWPKMPFISDNYSDVNMKSVQTCPNMSKSDVKTTMWYI